MIIPPIVDPREVGTLDGQWFSDITLLANALSKLDVGPGMTMEISGGGISIGLTPTLHRNPFFLAKITGHTDIIAGAKWSYDWTEVRLRNDNTVENMPNGRTSADANQHKALNFLEINNTAAGSIGGDGVDPSGSAYPAGFARMPVGGQQPSGTHAIDVPVVMFLASAIDGLRPIFIPLPNAHDGTCT